MNRFPAKFILSFLKIFAPFYFKKKRLYRYKKIKAIVLPGIFFPHFTLSTKLLLQFIEAIDLENKSFLELGCGIGIISVSAAKKGANVTASDINPEAVKNASINAVRNGVQIMTVLSDLFTGIPEKLFDFIVINPPYYPKDPADFSEAAWFCGENFEYYEKLFSSIAPYFNENSKIYMILSEDCKIEKIKQIGIKNNLNFKTLSKQKKWGEIQYIFRLESIQISKIESYI